MYNFVCTEYCVYMKSERIDLRVTHEEKMRWFTAAKAEGVKLAEWISARCNTYLSELPSPEQQAKNRAAWDKVAAPIGSTVTIKMPKRYKPHYFDVPPAEPNISLSRPDHDKTCQCGICDFKRKTLDGKRGNQSRS